MKKLASFILGFVAVIFIMSGGQGSNEVYSKSYTPASSAVVTTNAEATPLAETTDGKITGDANNPKEETSEETPEEADLFGTIEDILRVCSFKADVETKISLCSFDTSDSSENPYDLTWNYGEEYDRYVESVDWSLVYDADFFTEKFPMTEMLYRGNKDLMFKMFVTKGIHEGRQGSAKFNVNAYMENSPELKATFGKNYAAYYIYYMLNYDTEKDVNTVSRNDGKKACLQQTILLSASQKHELEEVNKYREEVGLKPLVADRQLLDLIQYRAYFNAHDGYRAHDWTIENIETMRALLRKIAKTDNHIEFFENNTEWGCGKKGHDSYAYSYRNSPEHYEAMIAPEVVSFGCSDMAYNSDDNYHGSQFDIYTVPLH